MANSLKLNLKKGDKVVMRGGEVAVCGGECFGSFAFTAGRALDIEIGGRTLRADGYDIDAEESRRRFAAENGWSSPC